MHLQKRCRENFGMFTKAAFAGVASKLILPWDHTGGSAKLRWGVDELDGLQHKRVQTVWPIRIAVCLCIQSRLAETFLFVCQAGLCPVQPALHFVRLRGNSKVLVLSFQSGVHSQFTLSVPKNTTNGSHFGVKRSSCKCPVSEPQQAQCLSVCVQPLAELGTHQGPRWSPSSLFFSLSYLHVAEHFASSLQSTRTKRH